MRLATWNVNSLRARRASIGPWLQERHPDILCLQETKVKDEEFPEELFRENGYHVRHWGFSSWNGVALAALEPIEDVVLGIANDGEEARCIAGTVGGIRVFSVYVPNGRSLDDPHYTYKLDWLMALRERLVQEVAEGPVVVAGDFNIAPTDADVYDPSALEGATHVSEPERTALHRLLEVGFIDCAAQIPMTGARFTWWDYRAAAFRRDMGMRIDLVLATSQLSSTLRGLEVDRAVRAGERPSDHAPLIAEF